MARSTPQRCVALAAVAALLLSGLVGCSSQRHATRAAQADVTVTMHDRVADGGKQGVRVTAGADVPAQVTFGSASAPAATGPQAGRQVEGSARSITPDRALPGAQVRFRFDPSRQLLPFAGGQPAPSLANAYLAVYDEHLRWWEPLATRFDAAAGELVADAPHFSWYAVFVVDPVSTVEHLGDVTFTWTRDRLTDGLGAIRRKISSFSVSYFGQLENEVLGRLPEEKQADCGTEGREGAQDAAARAAG